MRRTKRLAALGSLCLVVALLVTGILLTLNRTSKLYVNKTYGFSLEMPANFTGTEIANLDGASTTILLQNPNADGVQILISPWNDTATLTPALITKETGLSVTDPQAVPIAGASGLTFDSDNPAFDGDTREAWFIAHDNLYQISTYARDDALFKQILESWKFL